MSPDFRGKKILLMGLGLLGGGIAATKWLIKHGAKVTVTDLKSKKELLPSIKALGAAAKKVRFVLGKHRAIDFKNNEIVVVNPAVPQESQFLKIAKKSGARLENEASIFFRFCQNPIVAITGTRGKTTTANWIYHFLKKKYPRTALTGNSSAKPMLAVLDKLDRRSPVVVELSSWHLEFLAKTEKAPQLAIITNLYRDHLNRYHSMKDYALAKANIFKNQTEKDFLLLNKNNAWTEFFLQLHPRAKVIYFPSKNSPIPADFQKKYGRHNWENLAAAVLAAEKLGLSKSQIKKAIEDLPPLRFREEIVFCRGQLKVVNDATATSPEAAIFALKRFSKDGRIILIAGGTDKNLDFSGWARAVKKSVKPEHLFLLNGSATKKMIRELKKINYFRKRKALVFENLASILKKISLLQIAKSKLPTVLLFSPAAASFEKFKNEFDRGRRFNLYFKKYFLGR